MAELYKVNVSEVPGYWTGQPGRRFLASCLSPAKGGSKNVSIGLVELPPHTEPSEHMHASCVEEIWYIISGCGKLQVGDDWLNAETGDILYGPGGIPHRLVNTGDQPLKALWILSPPGDEVPVEKNTVSRNSGRST